MEEGENSSACVFRLEKKCGADRWISAIKLDKGTIVLLLLSCLRLLLLFIHLYSLLLRLILSSVPRYLTMSLLLYHMPWLLSVRDISQMLNV